MVVSESVTNDTIIILQARTASERLPGKVLKELQGIPMLSHSIRRLKKVDKDLRVIVATSDLVQDDAIEELARSEKTPCFRGSEKDVLDRFYKAAKKYEAKVIIRATGDNPLVDPFEARRVLETISDNEYQYVSGFHEVDGNKLPSGVGIEAFSFKALEEIWESGDRPEYREHINEYIFDNPEHFKCDKLKCLSENSCTNLSLTIDTQDEFDFVIKIGLSLGNLIELSTCEIIQWWKETAQTSE
jgi:spore coat polysaccharide biosynthesis protein SpsF